MKEIKIYQAYQILQNSIRKANKKKNFKKRLRLFLSTFHIIKMKNKILKWSNSVIK
jgi:hypothetical protein